MTLQNQVLQTNEIEAIRDRGYEILEVLGEGKTGRAFLTRYTSGGASHLRVLKVPDPAVSPESVRTLMNITRRDVNQAEVDVANNLQHPSIALIVDSFSVNGRTMSAQVYHNGTDLEALVRTGGPLTESRVFENVFRQTIDAVEYMHEGAEMLHRDIKPSNILVTPQGNVIVIDLQNAKEIGAIRETSMPTHGGTQYTHPRLLNALVTDEKVAASKRTDMYAVAASLFFALTGEDAFNYRLIHDPEGKEVKIGSETYKVKLMDGATPLESITAEAHERALRQNLRKVPRRYRSFLARGLAMDSAYGFTDMRDMKGAFDVLKERSVLRRLRRRGASAAYGVAATVGLGIIGVLVAIHEANVDPRPTIADVLSPREYSEFTLASMEGLDRKRVLHTLVPHMLDAESRLTEDVTEDLDGLLARVQAIQGMDKRLVSSWLRAAHLQEDKATAGYENEGVQRVAPSFVHRRFLIDFVNRNRAPIAPEKIGDEAIITTGVTYLKQCLAGGGTVADVLARYFSDLRSINTARVATESFAYFPLEREGAFSGQKHGYGTGLPKHQRDLVNTATALYLITDDNGNINFNNIPREFVVPDFIKKGWVR